MTNYKKIEVALGIIFDEKMLQSREGLKAIVFSMTREEFELFCSWVESIITRTQIELENLKKEFKK